MSASSILSRLRHKGQITEAEYRKLMDIKNSERHMQRVIEDIKAEMVEYCNAFIFVGRSDLVSAVENCIRIVDKHIKG